MSIIHCSIDVTKIDKSRLIEGKKGGKYLNFSVLSNRNGPDKYGNTHMVTQDVTKEERLDGVKGAILGNGKEWDGGGAQQQRSAPHERRTAPKPQAEDDDVPF